MNLSRTVLRLLPFAFLPTLAVPGRAADKGITVVLTTTDKANLLTEQPQRLHFSKLPAAAETIVVDDSRRFQGIDGFGFAITGGTAQLMMKMSPAVRKELLQELFGLGAKPNQIGISYIRVTVGASDMNDHVYTYDDMPAGETDSTLAKFSLDPDRNDVLPVLKEIVAIAPKIHILASPWTAPAWMKDNDAVKGGSLKKDNYSVYANYWVKYLQGMAQEGIHIESLTVQNEPENPKNTPSMVMTAEEQAEFIGKYLGPAMARAGLKTKIVLFDHNCDHPDYPQTILKDADAEKFVDGSGFHLYLGSITAMSQVHNAFPQKNLYFTEQMVISRKNDTSFNTAEPVARVVIGATRNWSRNVLLWNLAADPQNGPHTDNGGCPICTGAITLDGDSVARNLAYYTAAHASKFIPSGSTRIGSDGRDSALPHVAFMTPDKKHVLIVANNTKETRNFSIRYKNKSAATALAPGATSTYIW